MRNLIPTARALVLTATPEAQFKDALEVFRTEEEAATQFFYAYLSVHGVAAQRRHILHMLNYAPIFWRTVLGGLQTATFVALGRIFDQQSSHNIDRLLRIAEQNRQIFSKSSLGRRKQGDSKNPPDWIDEYLRKAYEPTTGDFRKLRSHVRKWRKIYEKNYGQLRDKFFAHKELADQTAVSALFAKTNIRELQRLLIFLGRLHGALWELLENGRKPILRPQRYSLRRMRARPSRPGHRKHVQELITHESQEFLLTAGNAFRGLPKTSRPHP